MEITYKKYVPVGKEENSGDEDENSDLSEESVNLHANSVIGEDDPYYQDMRKKFHLTDSDQGKYASSCFSAAGFQPNSSFN